VLLTKSRKSHNPKNPDPGCFLIFGKSQKAMIALIVSATKGIKPKNRAEFFDPTLATSPPNIFVTTGGTSVVFGETASFLGIFCLRESRVFHSLFSLGQPKHPITTWELWKTD
jgi:hypothetical protein